MLLQLRSPGPLLLQAVSREGKYAKENAETPFCQPNPWLVANIVKIL